MESWSALRGNFASPQREAVGVPGSQLMADGRNMVDQPQLLGAVKLWSWRRIDMQVGEGKHSRSSPLIDGCLNLGVPH